MVCLTGESSLVIFSQNSIFDRKYAIPQTVYVIPAWYRFLRIRRYPHSCSEDSWFAPSSYWLLPPALLEDSLRLLTARVGLPRAPGQPPQASHRGLPRAPGQPQLFSLMPIVILHDPKMATVRNPPSHIEGLSKRIAQTSPMRLKGLVKSLTGYALGVSSLISLSSDED